MIKTYLLDRDAVINHPQLTDEAKFEISELMDDYDNVAILCKENGDKLEVLGFKVDCMEPEDATFHRDLDFIFRWIKIAYKDGLLDGETKIKEK